jgi:hypothetical protein
VDRYDHSDDDDDDGGGGGGGISGIGSSTLTKQQRRRAQQLRGAVKPTPEAVAARSSKEAAAQRLAAEKAAQAASSARLLRELLACITPIASQTDDEYLATEIIPRVRNLLRCDQVIMWHVDTVSEEVWVAATAIGHSKSTQRHSCK